MWVGLLYFTLLSFTVVQSNSSRTMQYSSIKCSSTIFLVSFLLPNVSSRFLMLRNCILGDTLLNSLVGNAGVEEKGEFEAEEGAVGWSEGSPDQLTTANLTLIELEECLKEYGKLSKPGAKPSLPPGVMPEKDPSQQQYLPPTSAKHEAVNGFGDKSFSYITTYDSSGYRFKEKGYVVNPPPPPTTTEPTMMSTTTSTASPPPTTKPTMTSRPIPTRKPSSKDELDKWYKAFISVMSKYM